MRMTKLKGEAKYLWISFFDGKTSIIMQLILTTLFYTFKETYRNKYADRMESDGLFPTALSHQICIPFMILQLIDAQKTDKLTKISRVFTQFKHCETSRNVNAFNLGLCLFRTQTLEQDSRRNENRSSGRCYGKYFKYAKGQGKLMDLKVEFYISSLFVIHVINAGIISLIPHQSIIKANMLASYITCVWKANQWEYWNFHRTQRL